MANSAKILSALCLGSTLIACGGGGSEEQQQTPPPGPTQRITLSSSQTRTVFPTGIIAFNLSPALGSGESVACIIDGTPTPCTGLTGSGGQLSYTGLSSGTHTLRVEIRTAAGTSISSAERALEVTSARVVVYGGTPGGITAAVSAARAGHTVAILEPTRWVGGMMSGGLAKTDVGERGTEVISGLAMEVFRKIRTAEVARGICSGSCSDLFDFEPQVAERVFEDMLAADRVIVERDTVLTGTRKEGTSVRAIVTARGEATGQVFIDASYEGDLIAAAGIPFRLGREARVVATPGDAAQLALEEEHAGTQRYRVPGGRVPGGAFIDPYTVPGDPTSGTLPYVETRPSPIPAEGSGDSRVMAFTYRLCVTDDPGNRIPFSAPPGYNPAQFEAMGRMAQTMTQGGVDLATALFNPARTVRSRNASYSKHDLNGGSTFSIDMTGPGLNQSYVLGDETERQRIRQAYQDYIRGLLYFWQTDPRLGNLNQKVARFGLCEDEFTDRGGWPHQLYVRVGRRMIGEYVMNENDIMQNGRRAPAPEPIGYGAYNIDVHSVRYHAAPVTWPDGSRRDAIVTEGFLIVNQPDNAPYPISYRSLTPPAGSATNVLSAVPVSATHIAYAAIRMEPTFMMLGQAAGTAASLAVESQQSVQAIAYGTLRQRLINGGLRLP